MPAIQVAKTDTFESQRLKINEIGAQLFNISAGGSDLSTGNLKLGDGNVLTPSLAFSNDPELGVYRPANSVMGIAGSQKKIINFSPSENVSFQNFNVRKFSIATTSGLVINDGGTGYDPGLYTSVNLFGGTGQNATADITVVEFTGSQTASGEGYVPGIYTGVLISGGSTTGVIGTITVDAIEGTITNPGSGYVPFVYENVPITTISGSGAGARADITIEGETIYNGTVNNAGTGYTEEIYSNVNLYNVPATTYTVTVVSNPGTPPPDNVFAINGVTQQPLTLNRANTYRFDISDPSLVGHPFSFSEPAGGLLDPDFYTVRKVGAEGTQGSFVELVITPAASASIIYYCENHADMGATVSIGTGGTTGNYGMFATANVEVNAGGSVSNFEIVTNGLNYKVGDTLTLAAFDIGDGGSGFEYQISSFTYTGEVTDVIFINQGSGYETGDVISANTSNLGNNGGGFQFEITSDPGSVTDVSFDDRGTGTVIGDVLEFSKTVSTNGSLAGTVSGVTTNLSTATAQITVASTTNIVVGMIVDGGAEDTGELSPGTVVDSINSPTTLTLSEIPAVAGAATLEFTSTGSLDVVTVDSIDGIYVNSVVTVTGGSGSLPAGTTVSSIDTLTNQVTLSAEAIAPGNSTLSFIPPFGDPVTPFQFTVSNIGEIQDVTVNNPGNGYETEDLLTVSSSDLIQNTIVNVTVKSTQRLTFASTLPASTFSVGDQVAGSDDLATTYPVEEVVTSGGNISYILVSGSVFLETDSIVIDGQPTVYALSSEVTGNRYYINDSVSTDLVLYSGETYLFNTSDPSVSGHPFNFSRTPDGTHTSVENVTANLIAGSDLALVSSTTGLYPGMTVTVISGGVGLLGSVVVDEVVDSTTVRLNVNALLTETATLTFTGASYTDNVIVGSGFVQIKVTDNTASPLYYYCTVHPDMGGGDGEEVALTVDLNNPRVFGSGGEFLVGLIDVNDVVSANIQTGTLTSVSISSQSASVTNNISSGSLSSNTGVFSTSISSPSITNSTSISITSPSLSISGNIVVGDSNQISIDSSNGNITSSGTIKAGVFNSGDKLSISDNTIYSLSSNDLVLSPASGTLAKIASTGALVIPVGSTADRPVDGVAVDGSIRFNTSSGQYEGYNQTNSNWSSLGGIRDLDGNTFVLAEENPGANDNSFWFINDNVNTIKITPTHQEFVNIKSIRSSNVSAPDYDVWRANSPALLGDYLKYRNNIYEVTSVTNTNPGDINLTGSTGTEPTHTTGTTSNGDLELTYFTSAVSFLNFEEISEVRIDPLGFTDLVVNSDLRFSNNIISTDISDILLKPNDGQKVKIVAATSFVIPVGDNNSKGNPERGSIRYNTDDSTFEGFDGGAWGSLGGVKDIDGDTLIKPEISPNSDEDILYFFNANNNTLRLSTTQLEFDAIDTITSFGTNTFNINASTITFDNLATTLDNTNTLTTFLFTTKENFDLGLSAGLTTDPLLRLTDTGDIFYNLGFGTGNYNGVKIFDSELKELELADYKIVTKKINLLKGTFNQGDATIYDPAVHKSAKVEIVAHNTTTGEKEVIEYSVIDNTVDIFYTEIGNILTGVNLINNEFDFTDSGEVRLTFVLTSDVNPNNDVKITVVSHIIKR